MAENTQITKQQPLPAPVEWAIRVIVAFAAGLIAEVLWLAIQLIFPGMQILLPTPFDDFGVFAVIFYIVLRGPNRIPFLHPPR